MKNDFTEAMKKVKELEEKGIGLNDIQTYCESYSPGEKCEDWERAEYAQLKKLLSMLKEGVLKVSSEPLVPKEDEDDKEIKEIIQKKTASQIFTVVGQVEVFYDENPYFYDKSGMFFLWNKEKYKYEIADEVDVLNGISDTGVDTISSKTKTEIINALKQFGRKKIPEEAPRSWIQFKDVICDFRTGKTFEASPEYFITNPIPHEVGESEETSVIDKLFEEWVGKDYVKTLYEIIAYCCSSEQFMQRLIALVGGGANGKGTFLKLLVKFLGKENVSSSELRELSGNGFETSAIYRKLACIMGEISYDDLKNTNQIKKLSGEDQIRFCFKGKTPFTEDSITTLLSATNSLPNTPDKTTGFYRKWMIIDFPNQFKIKHGVIDIIPEQEFRNLSKKIVRILGELYENQQFTNEGDFEEREKRYEERSNPVMRFIERFYEEIIDVNAELRSFANDFNEYAKINHLRSMSVIQIGKVLREEGFDISSRQVWCEGDNKVSKKVILNLRKKTT